MIGILGVDMPPPTPVVWKELVMAMPHQYLILPTIVHPPYSSRSRNLSVQTHLHSLGTAFNELVLSRAPMSNRMYSKRKLFLFVFLFLIFFCSFSVFDFFFVSFFL